MKVRKGINVRSGEPIRTLDPSRHGTDNRGEYRGDIEGGNYTAEIEVDGYYPGYFDFYSRGGERVAGQDTSLRKRPPIGSVTYVWFTGAWGACTGDCGTGNAIQARVVECHADSGQTVADGYCTGAKPVATQACTASICPTIPATPSTPSTSDGTYADRVSITWSSVTNNDSYRVYRCKSTTTISSCGNAIASPSDTSYNDTGAVAGNTDYYRVTACNAAGCSNYSNCDAGSMASGASSGHSYTRVGDCVRDNDTGLIWEVKTDDGGCGTRTILTLGTSPIRPPTEAMQVPRTPVIVLVASIAIPTAP